MKSIMMSLIKTFILFFIGGLTYNLIEIAYRGRTHWSMFLVGGLCFVIIGLLNEFISFEMSFTFQMLIGCACVTVVEYFSGLILNVILGLNVWDYSNMPFNLHGQICLVFSVMWFFLSGVAIVIDDLLRWKLFDEEKPHYRI